MTNNGSYSDRRSGTSGRPEESKQEEHRPTPDPMSQDGDSVITQVPTENGSSRPVAGDITTTTISTIEPFDGSNRRKPSFFDRLSIVGDPSKPTGHEKALRHIKANSETTKLFEHAFAHHHIERIDKDLHHNIDQFTYQTILKERFFTRIFFDHFDLPELQYGADDEGENGEIIDVEHSDTYEKLVAPPYGSSHFSVLVGKVGRGKSLFGSAFIYKKQKYFKENNILPVRFSFSGDEETLELENYPKKIFWLLAAVLSDLAEGHHHPTINLTESQRQTLHQIITVYSKTFRSKEAENLTIQESKIRNFIGELSDPENGIEIRLLIVLDGLDYYYYRHDKARFTFEGKELFKRDMDLINSLVKRLQDFISKVPDYGLTLIVPLRKHVARTVEKVEREKLISGGERPEVSIFRIRVTEIDKAVQSRLEIYGKLLNVVRDANKREIHTRVEDAHRRLDAEAHRSDSPLQELVKVSSQGLRTSLGFLRWLSWVISIENGSVFTRIIETKNPLKILYILNYKARYSQVSSDFPNMFLNRADIPQLRQENVKNFKHAQTYWLKYIIAITVQRLENYQALTEHGEHFHSHYVGNAVDYAIGLFDGTYFETNFYDHDLVGLCFGSLSDENRYYVIEPEIMLDQGVTVDTGLGYRRFVLTERGKWLLGDNGRVGGAFSLPYLQLIIDDYCLLLPNIGPVREVFEEGFAGPDYTYLLRADVKTDDPVEATLKEKIPQIQTFIDILEVSLEYEKRRFPALFRFLQIDLGVELPDFKGIRSEIRNAYSNIVHDAMPMDQEKAVARQEALREFFQKTYLEAERPAQES